MTQDAPCHSHDLAAAVRGCGCAMRDITRCVICGRSLSASRVHVDTCGERCFKRLLAQQRVGLHPFADPEGSCVPCSRSHGAAVSVAECGDKGRRKSPEDVLRSRGWSRWPSGQPFTDAR